MKFFIILITFIFAKPTNSIKCYECKSPKNESCITDYTSFLVNCDVEGRSINKTDRRTCRTVTTILKNNKQKYIYRYCNWMIDSFKPIGCFTTTSASGDVKATTCTCDTDACNSAHFYLNSFSQNKIKFILTTIFMPFLLLYSLL
ncbi:unnamed protein product [Gordionus sp. m RMFG-2023]